MISKTQLQLGCRPSIIRRSTFWANICKKHGLYPKIRLKQPTKGISVSHKPIVKRTIKLPKKHYRSPLEVVANRTIKPRNILEFVRKRNVIAVPPGKHIRSRGFTQKNVKLVPPGKHLPLRYMEVPSGKNINIVPKLPTAIKERFCKSVPGKYKCLPVKSVVKQTTEKVVKPTTAKAQTKNNMLKYILAGAGGILLINIIS